MFKSLTFSLLALSSFLGPPAPGGTFLTPFSGLPFALAGTDAAAA
jgi:hypothetical protein